MQKEYAELQLEEALGNVIAEIWEKSGSKHSDKDGEWKVGLGKDEPYENRKITIGVDDGKIIKIDRK